MRTLGTVQLPNGVVLPHAVQGSSGIPLLLVHAVGDSWRSFEGVLDHLPAHVHAFAVTLRGHGDAGRPEFGYRSSDFAGDLVGFLDAIGVRTAVIVGGSSGGLVAQRFAIDHPDRTSGLVLLGSPLSLGNKPAARELLDETLSEVADPIDPGFVRAFVAGTVVRPVSDAFFEAMVQESLKVPAYVWKATVEGLLQDDFSSEIGSIHVPTLVVWGDCDTILPRDEQESMASRIPNARLVVYPRAGHAFYWEDPQRVARDLADFVGEIAV